jgi:hypothetical protein
MDDYLIHEGQKKKSGSSLSCIFLVLIAGGALFYMLGKEPSPYNTEHRVYPCDLYSTSGKFDIFKPRYSYINE